MEHTSKLKAVALEDVRALREAEKNYGASWKKRGGVGAFMMLARKWDRLENALQPDSLRAACAAGVSKPCAPWDVLEALRLDQRPEGILDDIRDLRRYLMLVEAEAVAQGWVPEPEPEDTETQAMMKFVYGETPRGDVYIADGPVPEDVINSAEPLSGYVCQDPDLRKEKYPLLMTHYEYLESDGRYVRGGSLDGKKLQELYTTTNAGATHPYIMRPELVEEYVS